MPVRAEEALEECWKTRQPGRAKLFVTLRLLSTHDMFTQYQEEIIFGHFKTVMPPSVLHPPLFLFFLRFFYFLLLVHYRVKHKMVFSFRSTDKHRCPDVPPLSVWIHVNSVTVCPSNNCYVRVKQWEKTCLGFPEKFTTRWSQSETILFLKSITVRSLCGQTLKANSATMMSLPQGQYYS